MNKSRHSFAWVLIVPMVIINFFFNDNEPQFN
jgi:hypothetical protein